MISTFFFFSASYYRHRWITIVSILFLSPFPFITTAPISTPVKNFQLSPEIYLTSLHFEGLLGMTFLLSILHYLIILFSND